MRSVLVTFETDTKVKELIDGMLGKIATIHYSTEMDLSDSERVLSDVEVILCTGLKDVKEFLNLMKELKLIQTTRAGADHLPFEMIGDDVLVCTTQDANSEVIAEHGFALLISCAKNIVSHTITMREGGFDQDVLSKELSGGTIGIVGLGSIGREIANFARTFGMKVYAINTSGRTDEEVEFVGTMEDLEYVLRNSDFIALSIPLTKGTCNLIAKNELEMMKHDAVFVNIARGRLVNMEDLYYHLKANPDFQAGFDVWWSYPKSGERFGFDYPFESLPNFIMTPHVASIVPDWEESAVKVALENVVRYLNGEKILNAVNKDDYLGLRE